MKKQTILFSVLGLTILVCILGLANARKTEDTFTILTEKVLETTKDGDIIFQSSQSPQCEAIRIATNSKFSHCGIIYIINGKQYVYEAVQPVKLTLLKDWISGGEGQKYVVKRLKNASQVLTSATIKKMKAYGQQFNKKDYDLYFEWSDSKIYCSELVWKIYKNGAGIELCPLEKLKHFNLKDPKVRAVLKERYGNNIPLNEDVVAPSQIAGSAVLETVIDTY
ncbi:YiiX family permuted papain-like enzyme [Flavobacterium humi]|uniref:YiiX family permuted papain-like enzyme n=1 Tax=Flavobacterium humi TaxID=2562683 RepID=A0A4Z0LBG0_9FLAO|nr:YiiX family permuted papain-like enzyme [Flavobacterium humi]TGD58936.1 YiiX family permuted papain-like enzyme [Flavobacterium humi]